MYVYVCMFYMYVISCMKILTCIVHVIVSEVYIVTITICVITIEDYLIHWLVVTPQIRATHIYNHTILSHCVQRW